MQAMLTGLMEILSIVRMAFRLGGVAMVGEVAPMYNARHGGEPWLIPALKSWPIFS